MKEVKVIEAYSYEDAVKESGFKEVVHNSTMAWNKYCGKLNGEEFDKFTDEHINKFTKQIEGDACAIVVEKGYPDTKMNPYVFKNKINKLGKRTYEQSLMVVGNESGKVYFIDKGKKTEIANKLKKMYSDREIKEDVTIKYVKTIKEGESEAFSMKYSPSNKCKLGTYVFFGIKG